MNRPIKRVAVLGLGRIGGLVGTLLQRAGFEVTGFDIVLPEDKLAFKAAKKCLGSEDADRSTLGNFDAVVSCLPHQLNLRIAATVHGLGVHYFDLTEDVATTSAIQEMSRTANAVMVPQCGLAPGFVAIVGAHLIEQLDCVRSIRLRVGALPQYPCGQLGYALTWSVDGVVNEYLNDCDVIQDGKRMWIPSMDGIEHVQVNGTRLEAFATSGGLGTMCDTYLGRVENLDYKTLRYPGHVRFMRFFFDELLMRQRRDHATDILTSAIPFTEDDVVYFYVSVEGDIAGRFQQKIFVRSFYPKEISGVMRTAISWTTSASACAVIEMVNRGDLPNSGFIRQEHISFKEFLQTQNGHLFESLSEEKKENEALVSMAL